MIERLCTQVAVYWGAPTDDGMGGSIFSAPIEIFCRWEEKVQMIEKQGITDTAKIIVSNAQIFVLQPVDEEGYLYLGTLDDLYDSTESSGVLLNLKEIKGAYEIKKFVQLPALGSTNEFLYKAFL